VESRRRPVFGVKLGIVKGYRYTVEVNGGQDTRCRWREVGNEEADAVTIYNASEAKKEGIHPRKRVFVGKEKLNSPGVLLTFPYLPVPVETPFDQRL